jgi:HSP20 family protein
MALVRWNPARDLVSMRDEMNRLFGEVFGRAANDDASWFAGAWTPPVDIFETEDALVMKAELPGFTKDDISIELKENALTLRGERKHEMENKEENYHRRERVYGAFQRSFMLPTTVDQNNVQATYKDGVLELRLPKVEAAKPKRISIGS